jgi:hypothetical protein
VSKLEDLEPLGEGELHHLHFLDPPASPVREVSALNLSADFPTEAWHGEVALYGILPYT